MVSTIPSVPGTTLKTQGIVGGICSHLPPLLSVPHHSYYSPPPQAQALQRIFPACLQRQKSHPVKKEVGKETVERVDHGSGKEPLGHILFFPFYALLMDPKIVIKQKGSKEKRDMGDGE